MQILSGLSMVLFIGVCSLVGVRLLLRARRTRQPVEICCALGFTLIGLLGYPMTLASGAGVVAAGQVILPLFAVGTLLTCGGIAAFFEFTRRVFRPRSSGSRFLVALASAVLVLSAAGQTLAIASAEPAQPSFAVSFFWAVTLQVTCFVCFGWIAFEGLREWRMASRRVALGLSQPEVADRFRLWALFGISTLLLLVGFAVPLVQGTAPAESPVAHVSSAVFGLISSLAAYLAFLPPAWYRARIRGSAA